MKSAMVEILGWFSEQVAEREGREALEKRGFSGLNNNPILQAIAMHVMQNPPPNLPMLADMYLQKMEKDLHQDEIQRQKDEARELDPLSAENDRLYRMVSNLRAQLNLIRMQREMAGLQGEMMAMMPNPAVAAAAQGMPQPQEEGQPMEGQVPVEAAPAEPAPAAQAPQMPPVAAPQMPTGPAEAAAM